MQNQIHTQRSAAACRGILNSLGDPAERNRAAPPPPRPSLLAHVVHITSCSTYHPSSSALHDHLSSTVLLHLPPRSSRSLSSTLDEAFHHPAPAHPSADPKIRIRKSVFLACLFHPRSSLSDSEPSSPSPDTTKIDFDTDPAPHDMGESTGWPKFHPELTFHISWFSFMSTQILPILQFLHPLLGLLGLLHSRSRLTMTPRPQKSCDFFKFHNSTVTIYILYSRPNATSPDANPDN